MTSTSAAEDRDDPEVQAQCASLGIDIDRLIPPTAVQEARSERQEEYEVWPEHLDAVHLLVACDTQWIAIAGFGGMYWQGLDFARAANVAEKWLGISPSPRLFRQLNTLVAEAKPLRNRHLERD